MYQPKWKKQCIDQDVIDGPHCTVCINAKKQLYKGHSMAD